MLRVNICEQWVGERLDKVLAVVLPRVLEDEAAVGVEDLDYLSRSLIKDFIPKGVYNDGEKVKPSYVIEGGEKIEIDLALLKKALDTKKFNVSGEVDVKP
ncbi:hypothetical protein GF357_04345, partial [Candidatus Dojkabacteria bacterium]|nr:hypothetical protein [Candidatus Dojkabacteria bacterium]